MAVVYGDGNRIAWHLCFVYPTKKQHGENYMYTLPVSKIGHDIERLW
jgi:hypothetical protein